MNAISGIENLRDSSKFDDLTAILGIGPARQIWFRESLDVQTYSDLAALSIDEIYSRLKADGKIASRNDIKGWIVKAQELATADQRLARISETTMVLPNAQTKAPSSMSEWNSIAAFFVQQQTRQLDEEKIEQRITVRHIPVAENGTWLEEDPKIEPFEIDGERQGERLYEWMQEQAIDEHGNRDKFRVRNVKTNSHKALQVKLIITNIRVFQPSQKFVTLGLGEVNRIFKGSTSGSDSFKIEISFELHNVPTSDLEIKNTKYFVRCYASNRSTGEHINLGETKPEPLSKNKLSYTTTLNDVRLPPGIYLFQVIVELMGPLRTLGFSELPMLQVVDISAQRRAQAVPLRT